MRIKKEVGETIELEAEVKDLQGVQIDLASHTVLFAYQRVDCQPIGTIISKGVTIESGIAKVTLDQDDALVAGKYIYTFKANINGDVQVIGSGLIILTSTLIPTVPPFGN